MHENAAVDAMETPITNENTVLPSKVAIARRAGIFRSPLVIAIKISVMTPDRPINFPIHMNSEITAKVKSLKASTMRIFPVTG
jgi:hypothetical protein